MDEDNSREIEELRRRNRQLEEDVERLLMHDQLTGLMIRSAFIKKVDAALAAAVKMPFQSAAVEIGIRGIPRLTGALGRHVGDYVISALAARLNHILGEGVLCARLDQWNFAVFIPQISDALEALTFAKSIVAEMSQPIDWVDRKLAVEVGAGVALASSGESDAATLLLHAGLALKSATEKGGPGYSFFNPGLAQAAKRKTDVLTAIQDGIDKQLFDLHYQPYFNTLTGELNGFEALLRLKHPEMGSISPVEFIPVAEEAGLIHRIGAWALIDACRTASTWPAHLMVSVNFSPEQFLSGTLLTDVHNALELYSFPAYRLEVEVTESTMLGDTDIILSQLNSLRELGCLIVMDDFGTGYSSLSNLWKFPFSKLKIDKSFVHAMDDKPQVRGMLQSIIDLGKNLGLKVTAEGIETIAQASILKQFKCDYLQGYLCGRPMPASDLAAVIMTRFADSLQDLQTPASTTKISAIANQRFEF